MDTFHVLRGPNGRPIWFNHVVPAISPIFGNNPGYQVFSYIRETGALLNYATFYLTNLTSDIPGVSGIWEQEYDFNRAYGLKGINAITVQKLAREITRKPHVQNKYVRYYNVSHTSKPAITQENINAYRCALENLTAQSFEKCLRGESAERLHGAGGR